MDDGGRLLIDVCRSCQRLSHVADDNRCAPCREAEEREISRLTRQWSADLDLLSRFELYHARHRGDDAYR